MASSVCSSASSYHSAERELFEEVSDKEIQPGILPGITTPDTLWSLEQRELTKITAHSNRSTISTLVKKDSLEFMAFNDLTIGKAEPALSKDNASECPAQSDSSSTVGNGTSDAEKRSVKVQSPTQPDSPCTAVNETSDVEKRPVEVQSPDVATEWERPISDKRWYLTCVGMMLGAILYGLDTTIAADIQGPILKSLGNIEKLGWVGIGFPMGSVSVILLVGCLYSLFEIKFLLIGFSVIFSGGSALCGAAPTMDALLVGRVVAGIGGAGMYLGALTYVSRFTSARERPIYNGLIGLCWGTGTILGPIVGGGFSETGASWRWAFYINLPLTAIVAPIDLFIFPRHNPKPDISAWNKLKSIDWIGAILTATIFALFQIILTFAGSTYAWDSAIIITLWSVFGAALLAYIFQQTFCIFTTPERRIFPIQFLKSRTMILLYIGTAASTTALAISIYYTPVFFQFTRGDSAIQAAVRLLPLICVYVFSLIFSSASLPFWGRYSPLYIGSGILLIVGGYLMHTAIKINTSIGQIYGYEVLIAIGAGLINQAGYSVGVAKVKPHELASALGFMNVAQIGTAAISLSIADCIFQNVGFIRIRDALTGYHFTDDQLRGALGGSQSSVLSAGDPVVLGLVLTAMTATIQNLWYIVVAAGAVSLVGGILMKHEKLKLVVVSGG